MTLTPLESPGFLLWHATLRWQRLVSASLHPFALSHVQFVVLASVWWLTNSTDPPSQVRLAQHAGTNVRLTSQVVRKLEARGLITHRRDGVDTRIKRLAITAAGTALTLEAIRVVEATDRTSLVEGEDCLAFLAVMRGLGVADQHDWHPPAATTE